MFRFLNHTHKLSHFLLFSLSLSVSLIYLFQNTPEVFLDVFVSLKVIIINEKNVETGAHSLKETNSLLFII